ncbi:cytochrome P450 family protein [Plantactinospora sonchi]|uniref:Cytochrome P450 n=1 Tax=Plantactinospora sonchi TaxID=1544735 RepID=A0ABU7RLW1_9ACTN
MTTVPVSNPFVAGWDLHEVLGTLRRDSPVIEMAMPTGRTAWLVTRYEDAQRALSDPRLSKGISPAGGVEYRTLVSEDVERALTRHMLATDPPDHTRLRRLVAGPFAPRRVAAMRPWIERIAERLLDDIPGDAEIDLLDAYAAPLPIQVICEMLGVPPEDQSAFRGWVTAILAGPMNLADWPAAVRAMVTYIRDLLAVKRERPGDDMLSDLLAVRDEGDRLSDDELTSMVYLLLIAGHETTTNLIANGMLVLLSEPERWTRVVAAPELLPGIIEELLRYEGPVQSSTFRTAVEPVEIGGQVIPAGATVVVSLSSANRDGARFPDPDRLVLDRPVIPNLAFGHGIHYCLGAPLARLEGQVAFAALARRFPGMRLAVPPDQLVWRPSVLIRGLHALPVLPGGAGQPDQP